MFWTFYFSKGHCHEIPKDVIATMKTLYNVLVLLRRTLSAIQNFMIVLRHERRQGKKSQL